MTAREISVLRDRVTRMQHAHEANRRDAGPSPMIPRAARCVYCGDRIAAKHRIACRKHRDVLSADPKYIALAFLKREAVLA